MGRVDQKICLITGGARGLGLAAAEALLAEGARVMITDINAEEGAAAAERLGANARFHRQDVTDAAQWNTVFDALGQVWGKPDVVVNNAGIGNFANIEHISLETWQRTIDINLTAVFLGTKAAVERMKAGGGSIINIASIEGILGEAQLPAYNASKGGVRIFTRSTAIHCARSGYGIRVNSVCPGFVETQLVADAIAALAPDAAQTLAAATLARIPMGRFAHPAEIAPAVLFLASDESSYVTGSDLVVDGGMTA